MTVLGLVGFFGTWWLSGYSIAVYALTGPPLDMITRYSLLVLPLFIFMGTLADKMKIGRKAYQAAELFIGHKKGGLAIGSILGCSAFGAVVGSSLATVVTIGKFAIPQMQQKGYKKTLAAGTIAAGGTLGILIPPSLPMIIYAFLTDSSVGRMFAAGIIPGLLTVALYTAVIKIWTTIDPEVAPAQTKKTSRSDQLKSLANTWQMLLIFLIVIGGIIGGFFPPSEGGAIGCAALLILGVLTRDLKLSDYFAALFEATMTTTLLYLIIIAVSVFNFFINETKIPLELASYLKSLTLSNNLILLQIIGVLILLGCILDALSLVFITIPFIFPIVKSFGFDPIWFGILMIVVIEIGVITPPVGLNIFALQKAVSGVRAKDIFKGVGPFVVADFVRIILLFTFPSIALWLPNWLYGVSL